MQAVSQPVVSIINLFSAAKRVETRFRGESVHAS
jgi:hypothetical protein